MTGERSIEGCPIAYVAFNQGEVRIGQRRRNIAPFAGGVLVVIEIIKCHDLYTASQKGVDKVAANEASTTGHKITHNPSSAAHTRGTAPAKPITAAT